MGLLSIPTISDGTGIDANDVNNPLNIIVNEINGNLNYDNLADSAVTTAKIANNAITNDKILANELNYGKFYNPYKFSAYMGSTQAISAATWTKAQFNTESYDTNSNYDTTTYGYTIPVNGYYTFTLSVLLQAQAATVFTIALSTNGTTEYVRLSSIPNTTGDISLTGSVDLYFTAGTVVYPLVYTATAKTIYNTLAYTRFSGHLISAT